MMEKELRRQQSTLRSLGVVSIAFSVWTFIKPFLSVIFLPAQNTGVSPEMPDRWVVVLAALFLLALPPAVWMKIWIGLSARAEGSGKKKGNAYMIAAFIIFAVQIAFSAGALAVLLFYPAAAENPENILASLVFDVSSVVITGELAFTARKVKMLAAQAEKAG